jgi:ribosome-associated toxin RatA of RatAB toxin-antitoxin module
MRHIHQDVIIAAPIEHVYELARDVDRQREWNPYMETTDVSGPIDTVGTTFVSTLKLMGQTIRSRGTVVEAEPRKLIHVRGVADNGGTSDWFYRFEPYGTGAMITLDVDYEMSGALAAIMDLLVYHGALDRATRHMGENFAALAESKVPLPA